MRGTGSPPEPLRVELSTPCPKAWADMVGGERVRFCGECQKSVYNLSAMTPEDAAAIVAAPSTACVAYVPGPDGAVQHAAPGLWATLRRGRTTPLVHHLPAAESPAAEPPAAEPPPLRVGGLRRR